MQALALFSAVCMALMAGATAEPLPAYFQYSQTTIPSIYLKTAPGELEAGAFAAGSVVLSGLSMLLFLQFYGSQVRATHRSDSFLLCSRVAHGLTRSAGVENSAGLGQHESARVQAMFTTTTTTG